MPDKPGADGNGLTIEELFQARPGVGLTYDDIIILPRYVEEPPNEIDLKMELAPGLDLNPIISSPMDTVTEWRMASQMALNGCLGVLHINLSEDETVRQVRKVKRFQMGFIWKPVCLSPISPVSVAREKADELDFSTFPIMEGGMLAKKFLGLVTRACVDLENNDGRRLRDVMIPINELLTPLKQDVPTLEEAKDIFRANPNVSKLPILNQDGSLHALVNRRNVVKSEMYPDMLTDNNNQLRVGAAVSTHPEDDSRIEKLLNAGVDVLVIDSSQGGTGYAVKRIKHIRALDKDVVIIAGNVVTPKQASPLFDAGANMVRVGMGSGSICITQGQYGLGRAQASAVHAALKGCIADGGIRNSGDMIKALALGAYFVMVGSYIAGCEEAPGELVELSGRKYRSYRGMGSIGAMKARGATRYGGSKGNSNKQVVAQGVPGLVPVTGPLDDRLAEAMNGIRGALRQLGCGSITELHDAVEAGDIRFELRSEAARKEGAVHDLVQLPHSE